MSRDVSGSNNDMTTPAGSTQRSSCGATLTTIGAPLEAQREKTAAVLPSKAGNNSVERTPSVEAAAIDLEGVSCLPERDAVANDVLVIVVLGARSEFK